MKRLSGIAVVAWFSLMACHAMAQQNPLITDGLPQTPANREVENDLNNLSLQEKAGLQQQWQSLSQDEKKVFLDNFEQIKVRFDRASPEERERMRQTFQEAIQKLRDKANGIQNYNDDAQQ